MPKNLSEREQIAAKTVKELQSPLHITFTKNNILAVRIINTEPKDIKMGYAINAAIMNSPYLYSIYREMEGIGEVSKINIVHKNLVDLCRMISTTALKKIDISPLVGNEYKVFTDLTDTFIINKCNENHYIWFFEKHRLMAASIKNHAIGLSSNVALINRRLHMIRAFLLLERMDTWMHFYPLHHKENSTDKVIRWVHHPTYEKTLAYWVSRGDKITVEELEGGSGQLTFVRRHLTRSIKQPDGKWKNVRENRHDNITTYNHSQLLIQ